MEKKRKIDTITAGFMLVTAVVVDLIQGLLTLSVVLLPLSVMCTFFSATLFFLWFGMSGVKFGGGDGGRKLLTMLATTITEIAPIINMLPAFTAGVLGVIIQTRLEEKRAAQGGKVTPNTAQAMIRQQRMRQARQAHADTLREEREETQTARHAANDDEQGEERRAA